MTRICITVSYTIVHITKTKVLIEFSKPGGLLTHRSIKLENNPNPKFLTYAFKSIGSDILIIYESYKAKYL